MGDATPVAAMRALGTDADCFLLELVEGSGAVARWSMLGHGPTRVITDNSGDAEDPLDVIEREVASLHAACAPGMGAPLLGGAVGFLTYEAAARYERLPLAERGSARPATPVVRTVRHRRDLRPCRQATPALELRPPRGRARSGSIAMPAHSNASRSFAMRSPTHLRSRPRRSAARPSTARPTSRCRTSHVRRSVIVWSARSSTSPPETFSRSRSRGDLHCHCRHIPSTSTLRFEPSTRVRT